MLDYLSLLFGYGLNASLLGIECKSIQLECQSMGIEYKSMQDYQGLNASV